MLFTPFYVINEWKIIEQNFWVVLFYFFNEYFNFDKIIKNNKKINSEFLKNWGKIFYIFHFWIMNDVDEIINQISSKMKYLSNFQKKKSNQNYHLNMNDLIDFQKKTNQLSFK